MKKRYGKRRNDQMKVGFAKSDKECVLKNIIGAPRRTGKVAAEGGVAS